MQRILIDGFYNDDPSVVFIDYEAQIGLDVLDDDDDVFYYFSEGEDILGVHDEFTVTNYTIKEDAYVYSDNNKM